jgi:hypothetical protein
MRGVCNREWKGNDMRSDTDEEDSVLEDNSKEDKHLSTNGHVMVSVSTKLIVDVDNLIKKLDHLPIAHYERKLVIKVIKEYTEKYVVEQVVSSVETNKYDRVAELLRYDMAHLVTRDLKPVLHLEALDQ